MKVTLCGDNLQVNVTVKLPTLLNKFLQVAPVSANEFVARWRALGGPPTKLQEVVVISNFVSFSLLGV